MDFPVSPEPNILGHNQPTSEMPFQWNFTGGLILGFREFRILLCANWVILSFMFEYGICEF